MSGQLRHERGTESEVFDPSEPSSMTLSEDHLSRPGYPK
jgi:hypothetical protein